jgi:hypothetical protein
MHRYLPMQYARQRHHSPGYVGQIMDPILRRFFLSSGTQLKSDAIAIVAKR